MFDTETMAELCIKQGLPGEALAIYRRLAASTQDAQGRTYLKPLTRQDIASALSAASAVGDDRIQSRATGSVDPESYTHGTSAQRQRWFTVGYQYGDLDRCDTLHARSL